MIFTQPSTAVKCGGAPQKIMYLSEEFVRQQGIRVRVFFGGGMCPCVVGDWTRVPCMTCTCMHTQIMRWGCINFP